MRAALRRRLHGCVVLLTAVVAGALSAGAAAQGEKLSEYLETLSHPKAAVRQEAATKLGVMGVSEAAAPLVKLLADPEEGVREAVRDALEQIADGAVHALVTAITADDPVVRAGAANVLGRFSGMEDERLSRALGRALSDPDATVRFEAASGLGEVGDDTVFAPLKQALQDPNVRVQVAAAASLARLGDPAGLPVLLKAAAHPDPIIRGMAPEPLGRFEAPAAVQALQDLAGDAEPDIRSEAYFSLVGRDTPETQTLALQGLKDSAWEVRRNVAHALGVLQVTAAADALLEMLRSDASETVRIAAGIALANLKDQRCIPGLIALLTGPSEAARSGAASALGTLEAKDAVKPLTALLEDEAPTVRRSARMALLRILANCPDCPR